MEVGRLNQVIERAIQEAEKKTSGEIAVSIVPQSDVYWGALYRWSFILSILLTAVFYFVFPVFKSLIYYFIIEILIMLLCLFIFQIPFLKRLCLNQKEKEEEVFQKGVETFYRHNLHSTQERNAVLLFVSLLEHRVELFADIGIHKKVNQSEWDNIVLNLTRDLKNKNMEEGFTTAIRMCGQKVSKHFPKIAGDMNELSNKPL